jgi:hypothetical protein
VLRGFVFLFDRLARTEIMRMVRTRVQRKNKIRLTTEKSQDDVKRRGPT